MLEPEQINERYFKRFFNHVVQIAFGVILIFIMLSLLIGIYRLFGTLGILWDKQGVTGNYLTIISDVLTLFILVELSRSLIDYFETHRFRITFIVDATIVFVMREIMIYLFKQKIEPEMIYALSAFLLVLTILRIGSIYVHRYVGTDAESKDDSPHMFREAED